MPELGTVTYRGREFAVVRSSRMREGETEPQLGILMETLTFTCPLLVRTQSDQRRICRAWLELLLEFTPSAWFCPSCSGLMIVDVSTNAHHYQPAHLVINISDDRSLFCYMPAFLREEDAHKTSSWLDQVVGAKRFYATGFEPGSTPWPSGTVGDRTFSILPQFYALDDLGLSADVPRDSETA